MMPEPLWRASRTSGHVRLVSKRDGTSARRLPRSPLSAAGLSTAESVAASCFRGPPRVSRMSRMTLVSPGRQRLPWSLSAWRGSPRSRSPRHSSAAVGRDHGIKPTLCRCRASVKAVWHEVYNVGSRRRAMTFTLRDVLALDVFKQGQAEVVAGDGLLNREVRWVHLPERLLIAPGHLRGGELVVIA